MGASGTIYVWTTPRKVIRSGWHSAWSNWPNRVMPIISEHTARLVQGYFKLTDLGTARSGGSADPIGVFELDAATSEHTRMQVSRARGLTAFVGRRDEMDILEKALQRAHGGHGQVVGVVGEPGLGKSRLCYEFAERCRAGGVPVYECHCPSYGARIPFIPILELFRNYFGISERDAPSEARRKIAGTLVLLDPSLQESLPTLFEFLGVDDPDQPGPRVEAEVRQRQLFNMLHKMVRAQSARGQVSVTLVDDLHWIDTWSDEFVAQMVDAVEQSHALLLVNYRPEYQAAWNGRAHCQQLPLVPLGADALQEMVASLLGPDPSVEALTPRVMEWTTSNPLYAEEVINTLIEAAQLEGQRGAYRLTRDVAALEVPASVQAIIAARIDRLAENEKALLHAAAVVGKEFVLPLIQRIVDIPTTDLSQTLERLKAVDLIFETALYPTVEYSFKHPLVHEVAYETQLRDKRERQHGIVAGALTRGVRKIKVRNAKDGCAAVLTESNGRWVFSVPLDAEPGIQVTVTGSVAVSVPPPRTTRRGSRPPPRRSTPRPPPRQEWLAHPLTNGRPPLPPYVCRSEGWPLLSWGSGGRRHQGA